MFPFLFVFLNILRREHRKREVGQEQGTEDDARSQEDNERTLREDRSIGKQERHREDDRERDRALRSADRGNERVDDGLFVDLIAPIRVGVLRDERHGKRPYPAQDHDEHRYEQHIPDKREVVDIDIVPRRLRGHRKLHAQEYEHDAVQREADHLPHARKGDIET